MNCEWDLSKLIKDNKEYKYYINTINNKLNEFAKYKGKLLKNDKNLYDALTLQKEIDMLNEKVYVYSYLTYYQNMEDERYIEYREVASALNDKVESVTSFVNPELLASDYSVIDKYINKNNKLRIFEFSLKNLFRYKNHILSDKEEKLLSNISDAFKTSRNAYDAIDNVDIRFDNVIGENGKMTELTPYNYGKFLSSKNKKTRNSAFKSEYKYYREHINTISSLYISSVKNNVQLSKLRNYKNVLSSSLFDDKINPKLYKVLIDVTNSNLDSLKKYYQYKSEKLGYKIHMSDLYVNTSKSLNKVVEYPEAIEIVNKALAPLGDDYLNTFNMLLNNRCVDVYPKDKKRSGAYEWGTYGVDPYVSLNFENNMDGVSTLAHEMGHAMHTYYSNKNQDYLYASYPIFLAEIASTVNEVLLSNYLIKNAKTKDEKIYYLVEFLDKFKATVFRQVMFAEFEYTIHNMYENGEVLTKDVLCDTYYELNKKHFAPVVEVDEEIKYEWARIPHFYTPFYVYKYATGFTAALIIADKLEKDPEFKINYINFLSSGSSAYPLNLLNKLGIDITKKETLNKAFELFNDKLELLLKVERDE